MRDPPRRFRGGGRASLVLADAESWVRPAQNCRKRGGALRAPDGRSGGERRSGARLVGRNGYGSLRWGLRGGGGWDAAAGAALSAPLCAAEPGQGAAQLFPTAPVLHHAQRPGPGAPRRHRVRDRSGAAGDPAPHREEPVQPAPAAAERAPSAQAGPAPEAPGSPAGLPAPQLAHAAGSSAARAGGNGAPDPGGAAGNGPEDHPGARPEGGGPAEHTGEGRGRWLLCDHQPTGADPTDEPVGTHPEAAAKGLPGGEGSPVTSAQRVKRCGSNSC